jgi:protein TonB
MQADGFLNQRQRHPVAMTAAITINAAAITALMLAKSGVIPLPPKVIPLINITNPAPPPPIDEIQPETRTSDRPVYVPPRVVPAQDPGGSPIFGHTDVFPPAGGGISDGLDPGSIVEPKVPPTPLPVLTDATPLASAVRDFQPPYPSQLLRTGVEGKAVVRVLVGTDGRVKQVAIISADDPLFADASERQALRKWRFRPATRDGVPVESWKQMTVRFEIRG